MTALFRYYILYLFFGIGLCLFLARIEDKIYSDTTHALLVLLLQLIDEHLTSARLAPAERRTSEQILQKLRATCTTVQQVLHVLQAGATGAIRTSDKFPDQRLCILTFPNAYKTPLC